MRIAVARDQLDSTTTELDDDDANSVVTDTELDADDAQSVVTDAEHLISCQVRMMFACFDKA